MRCVRCASEALKVTDYNGKGGVESVGHWYKMRCSVCGQEWTVVA